MPELLVIFYNLYYFTLRIIEIDLKKNVRILPWKLICHGSNIEFAIIILMLFLCLSGLKGLTV